MTTLNITEGLAESLERECKAAGTNITEVCREAGVSRGTFQAWKTKEPKTIREVRTMLEVINKKRQKTARA